MGIVKREDVDGNAIYLLQSWCQTVSFDSTHPAQKDAAALLTEWHESNRLPEATPEEVEEKRGKKLKIKNKMDALRRANEDRLNRSF
jgi:hypothetical protein